MQGNRVRDGELEKTKICGFKEPTRRSGEKVMGKKKQKRDAMQTNPEAQKQRMGPLESDNTNSKAEDKKRERIDRRKNR